MKTRPIIFDAVSVREILKGRKTQTRRVVNPQPEATRARYHDVKMVSDYFTGHPEHGQAYYWKSCGCWNSSEPFHCPFGLPGDRLWVQEPPARMSHSESRITLEIVSLRAERLQDITEKDAKAEGAMGCFSSRQEAFADCWNHLNRKRGFSWESNPVVWVIEFKRV